MIVRVSILAALLAAGPAAAQDVVSGDASKGLVSTTPTAEVHLIAEPQLSDRRLGLRIVILNRGTAPVPFSPADVTIAAHNGQTVALVDRDKLIAEQTGGGRSGSGSYETSGAHAAAAMPIGPAGQRDVSNFTGGMGMGAGGVPSSQLDRTQQKSGNSELAAKLDAALLKPMTIAAHSADGGEVFTDKLKRSKTPNLVVTVTFAGEPHRFAVDVPD